MKSKHRPHYSHAPYMEAIRVPILRRRVNRAAKVLRKYKFDAIAFRGMSGALLAPPIALKLDKTLIMVRKKPRGDTHSGHTVEGDAGAKKYMVVDDFMSTGHTYNVIKKEVKKFAPEAVCIGIYCTNESSRLVQKD